jgi:hypothetical protein
MCAFTSLLYERERNTRITISYCGGLPPLIWHQLSRPMKTTSRKRKSGRESGRLKTWMQAEKTMDELLRSKGGKTSSGYYCYPRAESHTACGILRTTSRHSSRMLKKVCVGCVFARVRFRHLQMYACPSSMADQRACGTHTPRRFETRFEESPTPVARTGGPSLVQQHALL